MTNRGRTHVTWLTFRLGIDCKFARRRKHKWKIVAELSRSCIFHVLVNRLSIFLFHPLTDGWWNAKMSRNGVIYNGDIFLRLLTSCTRRMVSGGREGCPFKVCWPLWVATTRTHAARRNCPLHCATLSVGLVKAVKFITQHCKSLRQQLF
jgi:hypothetical protein